MLLFSFFFDFGASESYFLVSLYFKQKVEKFLSEKTVLIVAEILMRLDKGSEDDRKSSSEVV